MESMEIVRSMKADFLNWAQRPLNILEFSLQISIDENQENFYPENSMDCITIRERILLNDLLSSGFEHLQTW